NVPREEDLFVSVRDRVHETLLTSPKLLELYRGAETIRAQQQLAAGDFAAVERSRLLTDPGFEAALRVAQTQLEAAQFDAARRTLAQLERHRLRRDRAPRAAAADGAMLARPIGRYPNRPDATELADRWSKDAGVDGAGLGAPFETPPSLKTPQTSFLDPA